MRTKKPNYMYEEEGSRDQLSKKRIQELKDATIKIGCKEYEPPTSLLDNCVAMDKWKEIMELYTDSNVEITTNADIGLIERYCHTYSEYQQLLLAKKEIDMIASSPLMALQMRKDIHLDMRLDKKSQLLLKMDTELFLTPLSKSRAIPKRKNNKPRGKLEEKGFNL